MQQYLKLLLFTLFTVTTAADVCPPAQELLPCTCSEAPSRITCSDISEQFDIKATFDRVSALIDEFIIFEELVIQRTTLTQIPTNTISSLKFKSIDIVYNENLEYISPNAFNATLSTTEYWSLSSNALHTNSSSSTTDLYDLLNQLTRARGISLSSNKITVIPNSAFNAQFQDMSFLFLSNNEISTIGEHAFVGLTSLNDLYLDTNRLDPMQISRLAFESIANGVGVDFSFNPQIDHMDEAIFRPLMDAATRVEVGGSRCSSVHCEYEYLQCDMRANWMCPNALEYEPKLIGFLCVGGNPKYVWDYCDQVLGR